MNSLSSTKPVAAGNLAVTVVEWVDSAIVVAATAITIGSLVIMFMSLMAEVVVRYLTNQGMGWPTEMPNILFPWLVMGGVVLGAQKGQHIAVGALNALLGKTGNKRLLIGQQVLIAATFFYLAWIGMDVIAITGTEMYPVTGITAHWAYLALIVGFAGLGLTALTTLVHLLSAENPLQVRQPHREDDV